MNEPLLKEVRVACSRDHAFEVFTGRIDLWWPAGHRPTGTASMHLEAEEGGAFYALRTDGDRVSLGTVLEVRRPDRLVYSWNPGRGTGPTSVEVRFIDEDEFTVVRVMHREAESGLGDQWPERVKLFGNAWDTVLRCMADYIANTDEARNGDADL